jgi:hypothetical protein
MASLLGCDDALLPQLARWTGQFVAALSPLSGEAHVDAAHDAAAALLAVLRDASAAGQSAGWTDVPAMHANLLGLLSQTYEATAGLLGNCIVARLRGDADADSDAAPLVLHTMRRDPSIHNTRRFVDADIRIGGAVPGAGQTILLVLAARDAEHGFGHGRHACPGNALAQSITGHALAAIKAQRLPVAHWRYRASVNARIPEFMEAAS